MSVPNGHATSYLPESDDYVEDLKEKWGAGGTGLPVRAVVVRLSDVKPESVQWLARGLLPFGKLVLVEGDPGVSKSTLTLYIAARVTRGESVLGAEPHGPRNVVLLTFEDGLADTVRPRIDALGGDAARVVAFQGTADDDAGTERPATLPDHLPFLRDLIIEEKAGLVIVDPVVAALNGNTDSHKDADVRRVLAPLAKLAEETGACILCVRHLVKAGAANALRAGGGSIGFIGAARVAFLVSLHPDDGEKPQHERRRVFACVKNNLAPFPPSRMFELVQGGDGAQHPRISWLGECTLSADDLNAAHAATPAEERDDATERANWLRHVLGGGEMESGELRKLARDACHPERSVRYTAKQIGVRIRREGVGKNHRTFWSLPDAHRQATPATSLGHETIAGVAGVAGVEGNGAHPERSLDLEELIP